MNADINADNSSRDSRGEYWCGSRRSHGIFWGLVLTIIGALWIGKTTGIIPLDTDLFWPSVMVAMGIWMLSAALFKRRKS